MRHRASPRFWSCYYRLPAEVRDLADRCYAVMLSDPRHPSLHFKKAGALWSVRVGLHYRAVAVEDGEDWVWVWIGPHAEYDQLLATRGG
jgi:hypothetical protein